MLYADPNNPKAQRLLGLIAARLDQWSSATGDRPEVEAKDSELCVVIGGDGWMLKALRDLGTGPTYLGVNAGRVGFLLNDVDGLGAGQQDQALDRLVQSLVMQSYRVVAFPLLRAEAWSPTGAAPSQRTAINDVFVERCTGAMALLRLSVDGATVIDQLACDGLIVATALGSTAYSFSAGGVPSHPMAQALHVTPICAHAPRLSPFVLPRESVVEIEVLRGDYRPVRAFTDGIEHGPVQRVRISPTNDQVRLAFLPEHDFTATLVRKILQA